MELTFKIIQCAFVIVLSVYVVVVSYNLLRHLIQNDPDNKKSELHSRDRYEVAEKMEKNYDSDLNIFMN